MNTTKEKPKNQNFPEEHYKNRSESESQPGTGSDHELYLSETIEVMHRALNSGMWGMEFDRQGKMISVHWSQEFRHMIGFRDAADFPDTIEAWSSRLHEDDVQWVLKEFTDTINDYTDKKTYDVEYRMQVKSGEWRWFHAIGKLIRRPDGTPQSYIGMFVDITKSKEQEEKLIDALKRAEEANKAKTTFLSHMSHDIRTPINGIMGMTTIALKHIDDKGRVDDCLHKIDDSSHHLLSLVNDILDMSRIDAGKVIITHDPFDLIALTGDCSSIIKGELVGRQVRFISDTSKVLHHRLIGDALHLRQIFINILGNSVKFTRDGDSISIRVQELDGESEASTHRFRFELADTGIGMSEDYLPKLFDSFSQEDDGSRTTYTGTGLGMAITKKLVDLLGGTILVESKLGEGTKMTLEFPIELDLSLPQDTNNDDSALSEVCLDGMKILVAEDNEINMEIATMLLEETGAVVTQAFNGEEALDLFARSAPDQFDVILMDVMMPVMNGMEATRRIRALDRDDARTIPIIAATANAYKEDILKTREAGMNAHVSKPLDVPMLMSLLKGYYTKKSSTDHPSEDAKNG